MYLRSVVTSLSLLFALIGPGLASETKEELVSHSEELRVGMPAPEFTIRDEQGEEHSLKDYRGKKNVVLAFYPKDFTGG